MCRKPMVCFYDREQVEEEQVCEVLEGHPDLTTYPWPPEGTVYEGSDSKWYNPQRYKMLSGFVYVPAYLVHTPFWLKIDTDVVAIGNDDWIKPEWFNSKNEIVAQAWPYTKPEDQFVRLDAWAKCYGQKLSILNEEIPVTEKHPNLIPKPGSDLVKHKRVISWCAFFGQAFTRWAAEQAERTVGPYKLPVPSQDGYLWYIAERMGFGIVREDMKGRGFQHWSTNSNVRKHSILAMKT
jgi:hypothetical protein